MRFLINAYRTILAANVPSENLKPIFCAISCFRRRLDDKKQVWNRINWPL